MKKQRKNYSFDAVVKSFMQYYQLPTKHDIEKLDEKRKLKGRDCY